MSSTEALTFPCWTEFDSSPDDHAGQYPLGIEAVGMSVVEAHLLPDITNATRRARYYSALSWIAVTSAERATAGGRRVTHGADQAEWATRLEALVRAATLERSAISPVALIGIQRAVRTNSLAASAKVDLTEPDPPPASAFAIAAYGSSFEFLGLGARDTGTGAIEFSPRATALAEEFAKSMGSRSASLQRILESNWRAIPVADVRQLREALSIREVPSASREHALLCELLLNLGPTAHSGATPSRDSTRARSLALILQVADVAGEDVDAGDIHSVFSTSQLPSGNAFEAADGFAQEHAIWMRYEERQFLKFGLYGLWYAVIDVLKAAGGKAVQPNTMHASLRLALQSSSKASSLFGKGAARSVRRSAADLFDPVSGTRSAFGKRMLRYQQECAQAEELGDRVAAALALILMCSSYWHANQAEMKRDPIGVHRRGGRARLSLASIGSDIQERGELSVVELLEWIIDSYVITQAQRVALSKLRSGQYRFFIDREEEGFRIVKPDPDRLFYKRDADRLRGAFGLMHDLGMLSDFDKGRTTALGRKHWKRIANEAMR